MIGGNASRDQRIIGGFGIGCSLLNQQPKILPCICNLIVDVGCVHEVRIQVRLLQILGGHASQTVQDQHQRVIELVRPGSAGGAAQQMRAPVAGKLSCGRVSLAVRETNWVLSLIQLADFRGTELACACAGTIPEPD